VQPLEDGRSRAVIVDLGVSRLVPAEAEESTDALTDITKTQIVLGTIGYMAPEQILGPREVTASADIYGLGAILFRMVAGTHVFAGMSQVDQMRAKLQDEAPRLRTGRPDPLARGFEAIVSRALHREPHLRYPSADEMSAALSALRDDTGSSHAAVYHPHHSPQGRRLAFGTRRAVGRSMLAAAVSIVLAVLAAVGLAWRARTPPPSPSGQLATPAPGATRASIPGNGVEHPTDTATCTAPMAPNEVTSPPPNDLRAEPRPPREARTPQARPERDAALMRAIRRAVQEEAYMTLTLPTNDEIAAGLAGQSGAPSSPLTLAGR
jgi:serine/threonine-protein kinase